MSRSIWVFLLIAGFAVTILAAPKKPAQGSETRFKQLDRNRSGKLSIKELWEDVKGQLNVEQTKKLYKKLDRNLDEEIEYHEYRRIKKTITEIKTGKAPAKKKKAPPKKKKPAEKK